MQFRRHKNREKGVSLFIAIAALVWVVIPMLGLLVDLGILYSAKARLQSAVDGAALAAARALNLGQTTAEQSHVGPTECGELVLCEFSARKLVHLRNCNVHGNVIVINSPSNANLRQVTVTATTNVPAWFMRYVGFTSTLLSVSGQASRKDLVAMLVLDRSGSMCAVNGVARKSAPAPEQHDGLRARPCSSRRRTSRASSPRGGIRSACSHLAMAITWIPSRPPIFKPCWAIATHRLWHWRHRQRYLRRRHRDGRGNFAGL